MTREKTDKLSRSLREKWASGTRKENPIDSRKKQAETLRRSIAEGKTIPHKFSPEEQRKSAAARRNRPDEAKSETYKKVSEKQKGKLNPPGPSARGIDHWKSKYWVFKNSSKATIRGWNLNEIIRQNSELFEPRDILWKGPNCKASKGLRRLFEMKKDGTGYRTLSWKGWMIGDLSEEEAKAVLTAKSRDKSTQ